MIALIDLYQKHLLQLALYAPKTVSTYVSVLSSFNEFCRQSLSINLLAVRPQHISQWMALLGAGEMSKNYLKIHLIAVKGFYAFMVRIGQIENNPAVVFFPLRIKPNKRVQPLAADCAQRLLKSIDRHSWLGIRNFTLISCLWALGLRSSELTSLKVSSFNPGDNPAHRTGMLRIRGKGKKERVLFVVDALYDTLTTYLRQPETPRRKGSPLFPTFKGKKALSNNHLQKLVKKYVRKADIEKRVTPHVLRHSFATEMYMKKVPLEDIKAMMGHETTAETAVYIHVSDAVQKQALELITINGPEWGSGGLSWLWWWKGNRIIGTDVAQTPPQTLPFATENTKRGGG